MCQDGGAVEPSLRRIAPGADAPFSVLTGLRPPSGSQSKRRTETPKGRGPSVLRPCCSRPTRRARALGPRPGRQSRLGLVRPFCLLGMLKHGVTRLPRPSTAPAPLVKPAPGPSRQSGFVTLTVCRSDVTLFRPMDRPPTFGCDRGWKGVRASLGPTAFSGPPTLRFRVFPLPYPSSGAKALPG